MKNVIWHYLQLYTYSAVAICWQAEKTWRQKWRFLDKNLSTWESAIWQHCSFFFRFRRFFSDRGSPTSISRTLPRLLNSGLDDFELSVVDTKSSSGIKLRLRPIVRFLRRGVLFVSKSWSMRFFAWRINLSTNSFSAS